MTALAQIHVGKKALGLDDDTYRAVLLRVTGKASAKDMLPDERRLVLTEFYRLGFKPLDKPRRIAGKRALEGPFAAKLQALWLAAWNLGLVRDRRDAALLAFVQRMTGIERTEWLREPNAARRVIEGLKAWLERDGGVDWSVTSQQPGWAARYGYRIAWAQWRKLEPKGTAVRFWSEIAIIIGRPLFSGKPTDAEWIAVMNQLGERIRSGYAR
ncbi:gp16 family protein [Aureimonas frigidaquae]|uniref:gp16 family protein n=1 Tax=Aureimonas frigidaquae TaxID=424757 RepID=UPI00078605E2|nr:regulatory protein GemA [Aureimonas frigidaquae]